ncbi:MAG: amidohydrolase/deacetylase family metallohydrolase, partial [Candidatus Latescibacteria bacterium]|nr:amidohydrolase/deacetylase family metallohydrolase [Candidatus Latescibacterota bacterium]
MKRLLFISLTVFLFALTVSTVSAQQFEFPRPDILLKGGHVIDPKNNINKVMDVLIRNGKIASVEKNIRIDDKMKVVDISGYYVSPGFVDIHAHLYYTDYTPRWRWMVPDSYGFPYGVTTLVDAGCSGAETFEDFKKRSIDRARVRVLAFLNISKKGMTKREYENDPYMFDHKLAAETAKKYPDIIVGFKTAHYDARNYDELRNPWTTADSIIAAGNLANLPCMFDFHPAPPMKGYPERSFRDIILKKMRPGDIYTHCYYPGFPTVDENLKVNPDVLKAQKRGVYFDVGHGGGSF